MFENLPEGWKVETSFTAPKDQTMAFGRKFGGRIDKLTNTVLSFGGKSISVNVVYCPTITEAKKIYSAVLKAHQGLETSVARDGKVVIEFAKTDDVVLMNKAREALGLKTMLLDSVARKLITTIPDGWEVQKSFIVSREQTLAIGKKLGGRIKNLSNTIFLVQGERFQVNVIECVTSRTAEKIHKSILAMKGDPAFCLRFDKVVVEFVGDDVELAEKAVHELGITSKATMAKELVGLLVKGDYKKATQNFDDTMKKALPAEKLQQVWSSIIAQVGPFKEQLGIRKEKIQRYDAVFVTCKFERALLDAKVVFNSKKQVAGLFFVPSQADVEK